MKICSRHHQRVNLIKIYGERLMDASYRFGVRLLEGLKSSSGSPFNVDLGLDIWRCVSHTKGTPSQHQGHFLFQKDNFVKLKFLPKTGGTCKTSMEREMPLNFQLSSSLCCHGL